MQTPTSPDTFKVDSLSVLRFPTREALDARAGADAAEAIIETVENQGAARIILASAPSQTGFLRALVSKPVPWGKVHIFHMDEYVGIEAAHAASFRRYQQEHVLSKITPASFNGIRGESSDPLGECERYARMLAESPIDVVCAGIGENGHLAFNDPPADLNDPLSVKVVELDEACRQQQVNDGCFPDFAAVPKRALTLTVPALLSGKSMFIIVPGPRKANAIMHTLRDAISGDCPATALRNHPNAALYIDAASAARL